MAHFAYSRKSYRHNNNIFFQRLRLGGGLELTSSPSIISAKRQSQELRFDTAPLVSDFNRGFGS
jgi:hypothetical protein